MPNTYELKLMPHYFRLVESGFNSAVLEPLLAELSQASDQTAIVRDLLAAFAAAPPSLDMEGMELISAFASLLLLLSDRQTVLKTLRNVRNSGSQLERPSLVALSVLGEWLGSDIEPEKSPPPELVRRLGTSLLEASREDLNPEEYLAITLGTLPSFARTPVADWLLDHLSSRERCLFAVIALMGPVGAALRVHLARGFAHGGPETQERLDLLSEVEFSVAEKAAAFRPVAAERVRPLSFDFQAWRYLLGEELMEGITLANDGTRGTKPFFEEATPHKRRFWHDLLVQYAHLHESRAMTGMRTFCATAAWALSPDSGIPAAEQHFSRELLRQSAFAEHLERLERLESFLTEVASRSDMGPGHG